MRWRTRGLIAAAIVAMIGSGILVAQESRVQRAATEATARYSEWLGPLDAVSERPSTAVASSWSSPATMHRETAIAYASALAWWGHPAEADAFVVRGVAWYLQSRVTERLFDFAYQYDAYRGDALAFFGGTVPYGLPSLRLDRVHGSGRRDVVHQPQQWPPSPRLLPTDVDDRALRIALALTSAEQAIGWPVLQGGLFEASRRARSRSMSLSELGDTLDAATGVDVSRVLDWYQQQSRADIRIDSVTSDECGQGCVRSHVKLTGTLALPLPVKLIVTLRDGQQVTLEWDGGEPATFDIDGPVAAATVALDPERLNLLDSDWLNNRLQPAMPTNAPVTKWTSRWLVWLQDGMLAYSALF